MAVDALTFIHEDLEAFALIAGECGAVAFEVAIDGSVIGDEGGFVDHNRHAPDEGEIGFRLSVIIAINLDVLTATQPFRFEGIVNELLVGGLETPGIRGVIS